MKVRSAIKRICGFCQIIRRGKNLYVRCQVNNRHKQRQGYHTLNRNFILGDKNFCECPEIKIPVNDNCHEGKKQCDSKDCEFDVEKFKNKLI